MCVRASVREQCERVLGCVTARVVCVANILALLKNCACSLSPHTPSLTASRHLVVILLYPVRRRDSFLLLGIPGTAQPSRLAKRKGMAVAALLAPWISKRSNAGSPVLTTASLG